MTRPLLPALIAPLGLITAAPVLAQPSPVLTVTFTVAAAPGPLAAVAAVPVSPWTLLAIAFAVALIAYRVLRGRTGTTTWIVAATLGLTCYVAEHDARAQQAATLNLVTSPATLIITSGSATVTVVNTTGKVATITGRTISDPQYIFFPPSSSPECTAGLVLQPGSSCFLNFNIT